MHAYEEEGEQQVQKGGLKKVHGLSSSGCPTSREGPWIVESGLVVQLNEGS